MAHEQAAAPQPAQLRLPVLVFGIVEVRRLKRELEGLEEFIQQGKIREPGKQPSLPRVSRLLDALGADNGLQLLQPAHRVQLRQFLTTLEQQAPVLHISFAVDPSSAFTSKMVSWFRTNVHPYALLEVGLQPTIAAGCIVRTTNKVFDFSLRERFADARGLLIKALEAGIAPAQGPTPESPTAVVTVAPAETVTTATDVPAAQQQANSAAAVAEALAAPAAIQAATVAVAPVAIEAPTGVSAPQETQA